MSPLDQQAQVCRSISTTLENEFTDMFALLEQWKQCDPADKANHWMFYKLENWTNSLKEVIEDYNIEVCEVELLEEMGKHGSVILN
tara:strand:+ start:193 stop:450 length:258 start_codon:yes stop_codon:yes gene_type:complete